MNEGDINFLEEREELIRQAAIRAMKRLNGDELDFDGDSDAS